MTTKEEAFFGVKNEVTAVPDVESDIEIDFVDDTPEEDKKYIKPPIEIAEQEEQRDSLESSDSPVTDEEIKNIGNRAQKRIKKLKREYHEERRSKELAERLSVEAVRHSQNLQNENQRLIDLVKRSQQAVTTENKTATERAMEVAEQNLRNAHDSGASEQISSAQRALTDAQIKNSQHHLAYDKVIQGWKQEGQEAAPPAPQYSNEPAYPDIPEPEPKALEWHDKNEWFGEDRDMTDFAGRVHDKIVGEGVDTDTSEYYQLIDSRMRQAFPDHFSSDTVVENEAPRAKANNVVAPAKRGSSGAPRKITLNATQLRLAKRIGITPQQYAAQLLKEPS